MSVHREHFMWLQPDSFSVGAPQPGHFLQFFEMSARFAFTSARCRHATAACTEKKSLHGKEKSEVSTQQRGVLARKKRNFVVGLTRQRTAGRLSQCCGTSHPKRHGCPERHGYPITLSAAGGMPAASHKRGR